MKTRIAKEGPVGVGEVMEVLGTSARSVVALCGHGSINKWALCKPMKHRRLHGLTDDDRREGNYGFSFAEPGGWSSAARLREAVVDGTAWAYVPPNGDYADGVPGNWQPCRLGDFRGYDHGAVQYVSAPGDLAFNPDRQSLAFFAEQRVEPAEGLRWSEMAALRGKYPCVAVVRGTSLVGIKTAGTPLGTSASVEQVELRCNGAGADLTLAEGQEYGYLMCACSAAQTSFGPVKDATARFMPIPAEPALAGTLRYTATIGYLRFSVAGVAGGSAVVAGQMAGFEEPSGYGFAQVGQQPRYLGVGASGRLALLVRIENTDSAAHGTSYLTVGAEPTLASSTRQSERPQVFAVEEYGGGIAVVGRETGEVSVPAGGSAMYVLYLPSLLRTAEGGTAVGALPADAREFVTLTLGWNATDEAQSMNVSLHVAAS